MSERHTLELFYLLLSLCDLIFGPSDVEVALMITPSYAPSLCFQLLNMNAYLHNQSYSGLHISLNLFQVGWKPWLFVFSFFFSMPKCASIVCGSYFIKSEVLLNAGFRWRISYFECFCRSSLFYDCTLVSHLLFSLMWWCYGNSKYSSVFENFKLIQSLLYSYLHYAALKLILTWTITSY